MLLSQGAGVGEQLAWEGARDYTTTLQHQSTEPTSLPRSPEVETPQQREGKGSVGLANLLSLHETETERQQPPRSPNVFNKLGGLAQLVERVISIANLDKVFGSIPKSSTSDLFCLLRMQNVFWHRILMSKTTFPVCWWCRGVVGGGVAPHLNFLVPSVPFSRGTVT